MTFWNDNITAEQILSTTGFRTLSSVQVTVASTITLTSTSPYVQIFTGHTIGQIVKLPDATTISASHRFEIHNNSTQPITIQDGSGAVLCSLLATQRLLAVLQIDGTIAGTWSLCAMDSATAPTIQTGIVNGSSFSGTPTLTYNVVFTSPFPAGYTYAISVSGTSNRDWGYINKTNSGFTIDSGARASFTTEVSWIAVPIFTASIASGSPIGLLLALTYN
jgi:hypothetical protein